MTAPLIENFKKKAKVLKKAVDLGDERSLARAVVVLRDSKAKFALTKAQHVVAVEAGFENWKRLISASEDELKAALGKTRDSDFLDQVQLLLAKYPNLTMNGFHETAPLWKVLHRMPYYTPEAALKWRADLFTPEAMSQIKISLAFLEKIRPVRVTANSPGSYSLKHVAERWGSRHGYGSYVSNGAFITASLFKDYAIDRTDLYSPNCLVGLNYDDLRAVSKDADPSTLQVPKSTFVKWLFRQVKRDDSVGDVARDAKEDLKFPRGGSVEEIRKYLAYDAEASLTHIDAFERAVTEWPFGCDGRSS